MTDILLHNSLTRRKERFVPGDANSVGMYVCGPTVYSRAHIGNARAAVIYDLLYRLLRKIYGPDSVLYVRNVTDVDDKINAAAKERGISIRSLTEETTARFHKDMKALGCLSPTVEPRATDHIGDMIDAIERLLANGAAYAAENHVLFSVSAYPEYGALSNRTREEMEAGARVDPAPYKKDPADFVLWKPSPGDEPGWESPWGRGRPGWHIECTAMSQRYLGKSFDIHGGGVDLIFPHHENERAQACVAHPGCGYARYWTHNGFLTVNGEKMSKSLGNFITMGDLLPEEGDASEVGGAIRLALLSGHYRKPINWSDKLYADSAKKMTEWRKLAAGEGEPSPKIISALCDDMNFPIVMAELNALAKASRRGDVEAAAALKASLELTGFSCAPSPLPSPVPNNAESDAGIEALLSERAEAKRAKNWAEADRLRQLLSEKGVTLRDMPGGGVEWEKT
ncbi:MAG: cysteine--tRNA ligase [Rickettsiales bacterium]